MTAQHPVISCQNVWKLFGSAPADYLSALPEAPDPETLQAAGYVAAVRDVTLDVHQGEILVVMGLSGSGKSTLLRCMSRLLDISGGTIRVDGQDIGALSERGLIELRRSKMGMVFQNFGLLPHRTVLGNVAFPLEMRGQDRHDRRDRAMEVIELVGLTGREDHFPHELSGGQQQRVGIARSLAIEPDIWFLDEPFSSLDPLIRREMQEEFLRLQSGLGKTIVFITHDFDEALRLADRIAIMKDGVVVQCDTPEKVVLEPATPYVSQFTENIDKARVVRAGGMMVRGVTGTAAEGDAVSAQSTLHELARTLVDDDRDSLPVEGADGRIIGMLDRQDALDLVVGTRT
ncbi:MAG: ATP-binding cassette domain-containing protein [Pseudotabrizicola sp.]|uniref:quaternary amine ABC transporter ATP-binding protein n=1 Tax=Pseudotabrizicola sp. TaxID=2939647 RepID=UPI0027249CCB|nr:ATP-binding cassette domain-containing protein [Pseudotabrizicola sp.]MDO9638324.1 ATP-binding cassette domain-containing protein [Pseudotabrizicola sp.]